MHPRSPKLAESKILRLAIPARQQVLQSPDSQKPCSTGVMHFLKAVDRRRQTLHPCLELQR